MRAASGENPITTTKQNPPKHLATDKAYLVGWLVFGVPSSVTLLVYNLTAAAGLSWRHGGEDGGDLAVAMGLLGIPHPTGYPLYLLASRPFLLFSAEPARALNLASAFWGALAIGLFSLATFHFIQIIFAPEASTIPTINNTIHKILLAAGSGIFTGLLLTFAPLVWSQSLIAEVYSFNLMLMALLLLALALWWGKPSSSRLPGIALVLGLGVSHHRTIIFTGLSVILFIILTLRAEQKESPLVFPKSSLWLKCSAIFLAGLLVPYVYLLIRGDAVPASNWSAASLANPQGIWQQFSGSDYRNLLFAAPLSQSLGRISASANLLLQQFGYGGLLVGWLGLVGAWLTPAARPLFWLALGGIILHISFAAVYAAENSQVYLIPAFALWALLAGWGLGWITLKVLTSDFWNGKKWIAWAGLLLVLIVLPALSLISNFARLDLSKDRSAETWAKTRLETAPANGLLLSYSDATTFALWYGQYIQNQRPDLIIMDARLFGADWYRRNLARLYPALKFPEETKPGATGDLSAILATANPGRPLLVVTEPADIENKLP